MERPGHESHGNGSVHSLPGRSSLWFASAEDSSRRYAWSSDGTERPEE